MTSRERIYLSKKPQALRKAMRNMIYRASERMNAFIRASQPIPNPKWSAGCMHHPENGIAGELWNDELIFIGPALM